MLWRTWTNRLSQESSRVKAFKVRDPHAAFWLRLATTCVSAVNIKNTFEESDSIITEAHSTALKAAVVHASLHVVLCATHATRSKYRKVHPTAIDPPLSKVQFHFSGSRSHKGRSHGERQGPIPTENAQGHQRLCASEILNRSDGLISRRGG